MNLDGQILKPQFQLPKRVEHYLAALSELYSQDGKRHLQEIVVNASVVVHEGWTSDNWNGGTYGHALFFTIPKSLFLSCVKQKEVIRASIKDDFNALHSFEDEHLAEVFLDFSSVENEDWRKDSGLQIAGKKIASPESVKRIWAEDCFRIFLSHKTEVKRETAALKESLRLFGISCFVAHEDIIPTREWQDEIENALASMDGFVALLTDTFHDSNWMDQEVGYAFSRGVPLIAARLGKDPYGFIGKFQGLACTWSTAAEEIVRLLLTNARVFSVYVAALRKCPSWESGNTLGLPLKNISGLTEQQVDDLILAYNETSELRGAFAFNGIKPSYYGPGLVKIVNQQGSRRFRFGEGRLIEAV